MVGGVRQWWFVAWRIARGKGVAGNAAVVDAVVGVAVAGGDGYVHVHVHVEVGVEK